MFEYYNILQNIKIFILELFINKELKMYVEVHS